MGINFVTVLPQSDGYNVIPGIIDRSTTMQHLIPCRDTADSADVARIYHNNFWKLHELIDWATSERGPLFTSKLWKHLSQILGIKFR